MDLSGDALSFFHAHVGLDVEHAKALITVVNRGIKSVTDASNVVIAIREALAARAKFFDGIQRCAQSSA